MPNHSTFRYFLCGLLLTFSATLWGQTSVRIPINLSWNEQAVRLPLIEGKTVETVQFEGAHYAFPEHNLPVWGEKISLAAAGRLTAHLEKAVYAPITLPEAALNGLNELPGADIAVQVQLTKEKKQPFAHLSLIPIRKNPTSGGYEKLVSGEVVVQLIPQAAARSTRTYTDELVLNKGTFYKFKVNADGVYKIDRNFMQQLGLQGAITFSNVRIYGNGGGTLPELAGGEKYDDLVENPLQVVDQNQNNVFDNDDYLLFFAQSPDRWTYNTADSRFNWNKNPYTTHNFYFLTVDLGSGKRIGNANAPAQSPTVTVNTFNEHVVHDEDLFMPNHSGRTWFGEQFRDQSSQTFTFSTPNLVSGSGHLTAQVAARSLQGSSVFRVLVNGSTIYTTSSLVATQLELSSPYAIPETIKTAIASTDNNTFQLTLAFQPPNTAAFGMLNYLAINARRQLQFTGGQFLFRDAQSVQNGAVAQFQVAQLPGDAQIWDVTRIDNVQRVAQGSGTFLADASTLREYIAFDNTQFLTPETVGLVARQNLHANEFPDMVIVTAAAFLSEAERLANFHRTESGLSVKVADMEHVYNEFSSGAADMTAVRDYMKMYYDRADNNAELMPQYLLLFGDASYDYRNLEFSAEENTNFVPTYETVESLITYNSYCTDDYFGYLDDEEGANILIVATGLDIGIGRLPVKTATEAKDAVDKIIHYYQPETMGDWRNKVCFIGDDEDGNLYFNQSETLVTEVDVNYPAYNINKIYLDAYQQVFTPGGGRYPDVNEAISNQLFSGALVMNYTGHGGEEGFAHERIFRYYDIPNLTNIDRLPLFVTVTCSLAPYDNPEVNSVGEQLMLHSKGGAIAMMTTIRVVTTDPTLNKDFLHHLFLPIDGGQPALLGEVARRAKNQSAGNPQNRHKFGLLGDPALRLAYPEMQNVFTTAISNDTMKALSHISVSGELRDAASNRMTNYNRYTFRNGVR